jgi:hypothetical protein
MAELSQPPVQMLQEDKMHANGLREIVQAIRSKSSHKRRLRDRVSASITIARVLVEAPAREPSSIRSSLSSAYHVTWWLMITWESLQSSETVNGHSEGWQEQNPFVQASDKVCVRNRSPNLRSRRCNIAIAELFQPFTHLAEEISCVRTPQYNFRVRRKTFGSPVVLARV